MSLLWRTATLQIVSSRADTLWGAQDPDKLFQGNPTTIAPFDRVGRRKNRHDYDKTKVTQMLREKPELTEVDPRTVAATQPSVTRGGVKHYLSDEYQHHGTTFADQDNPGNRYPVVYKRDDGTNLLLSGHHRATAALLQGRMLPARVVSGGWPEKGEK